MNLLRLKHLFAGCLLAVSTLPAWGQSAPTLAIRIDDLGAFHSVNEACIQTYQSGIARSVEVMPVAAWYPEAVRLLKENPGLDAGLHLVKCKMAPPDALSQPNGQERIFLSDAGG